ncbi:MAG: hypothetical protein ABI876_03725 [Bacteroidota bacterium]
MKFNRLLMTALLLGAALTVQRVHAQGTTGGTLPNEQFGIGMNIDGVSAQYAFSPNVQAGMIINLWHMSGGAASSSSYAIGPFVRYTLDGVVNPFLQGNLAFTSSTDADSQTNMTFLAGLEYFFTRNVGAFAATPVLEFTIGGAGGTGLGIGARVIGGGEWFFNR